MSKRLQILLGEAELKEIRRIARAQRMTVADWLRQALRTARRREPLGEVGEKLVAAREAAQHAYPTENIGHMLSEIERGYLGDADR